MTKVDGSQSSRVTGSTPSAPESSILERAAEASRARRREPGALASRPTAVRQQVDAKAPRLAPESRGPGLPPRPKLAETPLPALPALETDRPMKHVRSDELRAAIAARPRQRSAARQAHIDDLTSRGFVPLSAYEQNMARLKNDNHGDDPREYDLDRAVLAPGFSEIPKAAEAGKPQTRGRSKR